MDFTSWLNVQFDNKTSISTVSNYHIITLLVMLLQVSYIINLSTTEKALILAATFLFFLLLENVIPLLRLNYKKLRHAGINLLFVLLNVIVTIPFAFLAIHLSDWTSANKIGFLHLVEMPGWLFIIIGFLFLDFIGSYLSHWVQHRVKWMWKFHLVHHTDVWVDTTTANRHHPGETVIGMLFLIAGILLTGAPAWLVIIFQFISTAYSQFIHANISLPAWLDSAISKVFVSPNVHKVHHHHTQPLTDTNYGNIFSIWDRLFKTYSVPEIGLLKYGIDTHPLEKEHNNMGKLLVIPFEEYRSPTTQAISTNLQPNAAPIIKIMDSHIPSQTVKR